MEREAIRTLTKIIRRHLQNELTEDDKRDLDEIVALLGRDTPVTLNAGTNEITDVDAYFREQDAVPRS